MISASVPKVFYILHVLKRRQVGVEGMKICHLAIFLLEIAGTSIFNISLLFCEKFSYYQLLFVLLCALQSYIDKVKSEFVEQEENDFFILLKTRIKLPMSHLLNWDANEILNEMQLKLIYIALFPKNFVQELIYRPIVPARELPGTLGNCLSALSIKDYSG